MLDQETITFEQLCKVSPELREIKAQAARANLNDWQKYESLKRRMASCVGMYAHPGLPGYMLSSEAYELAHREIFGGAA